MQLPTTLLDACGYTEIAYLVRHGNYARALGAIRCVLPYCHHPGPRGERAHASSRQALDQARNAIHGWQAARNRETRQLRVNARRP